MTSKPSFLAQLLESAGFYVRTAADAENGMRVYSEWRPHFIWLDLRSQGTSPLEAITNIRALPGGRDAKIAALTTGSFADQRDAVLGAGADDFVRKPWTPRTVFEIMERLLGVRYANSPPAARPVVASAPYDLSGFEALPADLRSHLLNAVMLLDKERIIEAVRSISAIDPRWVGN